MKNSIVDLNSKYKRKDSLIRLKLLEYIPILVISNLSTLLILTVDGIVVGNFVGSEALAEYKYFLQLRYCLWLLLLLYLMAQLKDYQRVE